MSSKDLRAKLLENSESLQKYRFQKSIQQLEDYKVINQVKKENAKILTILSQLDDMEESNG
jgi:large subunit ribosomal protein L29